MDTFARRLEILNYVRQQGAPVSTEQITRHLDHEGYVAEELSNKSAARVVQRDLQMLLGSEDEDGEPDNPFGLMRESIGRRTVLWSVDPYGTAQFDFESMPQNMALTLTLCQKHLGQVLPKNTQYELQRFFDSAQDKLGSRQVYSQKDYHRLKDSVEFYQRGQSLKAPDIDMTILDTCYRAILMNRQLSFTYQRGDREQAYTVNPLGVAFLLPKIYLVATKADDSDSFRSFLVHKMAAATLSDKPIGGSEAFSLRAYLEDGHLDVLIQQDDHSLYDIEIELIEPSDRLIEDLRESPLNSSQKLLMQNGLWVMRLKARRTIQLRNWLLALGPAIELKSPAILRQDLLAFLRASCSVYETTTS